MRPSYLPLESRSLIAFRVSHGSTRGRSTTSFVRRELGANKLLESAKLRMRLIWGLDLRSSIDTPRISVTSVMLDHA